MNRGFTQAPFPSPAFGQADLSNCEREQIHLAASIQPHGALLLVREADGVVVQALQILVVVMMLLKMIDPLDEIVRIVVEEIIGVAVSWTVIGSAAQLAGIAVRLHQDTMEGMRNGLVVMNPFQKAILKVCCHESTTDVRRTNMFLVLSRTLFVGGVT